MAICDFGGEKYCHPILGIQGLAECPNSVNNSSLDRFIPCAILFGASMDRPRIRVDFNELAASDLVLLSKEDNVRDSDGKEIFLAEGIEVFVYEFNAYENGEKEYLLADGIAELNDPEVNGRWSKAAKWCCRINSAGIRIGTPNGN